MGSTQSDHGTPDNEAGGAERAAHDPSSAIAPPRSHDTLREDHRHETIDDAIGGEQCVRHGRSDASAPPKSHDAPPQDHRHSERQVQQPQSHDQQSQLASRFFDALQRTDVQGILDAIRAGLNPNLAVVQQNGMPANFLGYALQLPETSAEPVVDALLVAKADANPKGSLPPVMTKDGAARFADGSIVRQTPLMDATMRGFSNVVCLLLQSRADVSHRGLALSVAQFYFCIEGDSLLSLKLLLEARLDPGSRSKMVDGVEHECCTLLQHATVKTSVPANAVDIVKLLCQHRANPNTTCQCPSLPPLACQCLNKNVAVVQVLLEAAADVNRVYPSSAPGRQHEQNNAICMALELERCNDMEEQARSEELVGALFPHGLDLSATMLTEQKVRLSPVQFATFAGEAFNARGTLRLLGLKASVDPPCFGAAHAMMQAFTLVDDLNGSGMSQRADKLFFRSLGEALLVVASLVQARADIGQSMPTLRPLDADDESAGKLDPRAWTIDRQASRRSSRYERLVSLCRGVAEDVSAAAAFSTLVHQQGDPIAWLGVALGFFHRVSAGEVRVPSQRRHLQSDAIPCHLRAGTWHGPVPVRLIPGIDCRSQTYIRLRAACPIEALLGRDVGALKMLINDVNAMADAAVEQFKKEVEMLIDTAFPGAAVVEAGSTARGTAVACLSDIDLTCFPQGITTLSTRELCRLQEDLKAVIREVKPKWSLKQQKLAVTIVAPAQSGWHRHLKADVCIALRGDERLQGPGFPSHAEARANIMDDLPEEACKAAQILRAVLRAFTWPPYSTRPPSYLIDVLVKYMWEQGAPRACLSRHQDPRPYVVHARGCYLFRRCSALARAPKPCQICGAEGGTLKSFFECLDCGTLICTAPQCMDSQIRSLRESEKARQTLFPFPKHIVKTFTVTSAEKYARFGNEMWLDAPAYRPPVCKLDTADLVYAFFRLCSHFARVGVIFDESALPEDVKMPYVQDPGCVGNNMVERFDFEPLAKICDRLIDDSGRGLYPAVEFLTLRCAIFRPFQCAPVTPNLLVTVYVWCPVMESLFAVVVNPEWSFFRLWQCFAGSGKETPEDIWLYPWYADFVSEKGVVADWSAPLSSHSVKFGSFLYFDYPEHLAQTKGIIEPWGELDPESLTRGVNMHEPRFQWISPEKVGEDPFVKVLVDRHILAQLKAERGEDYHKDACVAAAACHFRPSLNRVRMLGPDFDWRDADDHWENQGAYEESETESRSQPSGRPAAARRKNKKKGRAK